MGTIADNFNANFEFKRVDGKKYPDPFIEKYETTKFGGGALHELIDETKLRTHEALEQIENGEQTSINADKVDGYEGLELMDGIHSRYVDFIVEGDADTYYPVGISGGAHYGFHRYSISRPYSWQAPETWNNSTTHKGGLTFTWEWSADSGWGGNDKSIRIIEFSQTYSSMVAGLQLAVSHGPLVIWLRGGGAQYRLHSTRGKNAIVNIYLDGFTAADKTTFLPRTTLDSVDGEINARYPVRGNGGLYDSNNKVWTEGNDGAGSGLDADKLDGFHETSFSRNNRGSIQGADISNVNIMKNLKSGNYCVIYSGYTKMLVVQDLGAGSCRKHFTLYHYDSGSIEVNTLVDGISLNDWVPLATGGRNIDFIVDNLYAVGTAARKASVVYAGTGTINTSDAREKTEISKLTENELSASKQLLDEIGTYKWLYSVGNKGEEARIHIGLTVQRAIEIFEENDLDAFKYGLICHDKWNEEVIEHPAELERVEKVPVMIEEEYEEIDLVFEDGKYFEEKVIKIREVQKMESIDIYDRGNNVIRSKNIPVYEEKIIPAKEAWTEVIQEAGDRYGFRYDQLNQFLIAGLNAKLNEE